MVHHPDAPGPQQGLADSKSPVSRRKVPITRTLGCAIAGERLHRSVTGHLRRNNVAMCRVGEESFMDVSKIPTGRAPPHDVFVVVEIPQGSSVKYEVDKDSGAVFVDRFLFTATAYPSA